MARLLDALYLLVLVVLSPWLLWRCLRTGRYRRGFWAKLSGGVDHPLLASRRSAVGKTVWFHGVSVGEIHLLRQVIALARKRNPTWRVVVSVSTDTGFEEARKAFPDLPVISWPLDFSWAVSRALRRVGPDLVVLAESELWPNFLRAAQAQRVPVVVLNGRMSPRSTRRFLRFSGLAGTLFRRLHLVLAQNEEYAANYRRLGVGLVQTTGSVKYDGVQTDPGNPRTAALRQLFGIRPDDLVWVAGSTQTPEEEVALAAFRQARQRFPNLRLILVPRQKDRFDEVARFLEREGETFLRRSALHSDSAERTAPIVLVDTIGELGAVWGLADVAFVGGSLDGQRGGQNMIEPAAYGAAVLFGPHVWNFQETARRLLEAGGARQVQNAEELTQAVCDLLADAGARLRLGRAATDFVLSQQGATLKSVRCLEQVLDRREDEARAA